MLTAVLEVETYQTLLIFSIFISNYLRIQYLVQGQGQPNYAPLCPPLRNNIHQQKFDGDLLMFKKSLKSQVFLGRCAYRLAKAEPRHQLVARAKLCAPHSPQPGLPRSPRGHAQRHQARGTARGVDGPVPQGRQSAGGGLEIVAVSDQETSCS